MARNARDEQMLMKVSDVLTPRAINTSGACRESRLGLNRPLFSYFSSGSDLHDCCARYHVAQADEGFRPETGREGGRETRESGKRWGQSHYRCVIIARVRAYRRSHAIRARHSPVLWV